MSHRMSHPPSIAGDWKATALNAEVWVETVTEGGRRFMAAWRKEEVDAARHRQEKREATRLGTLLSQTVSHPPSIAGDWKATALNAEVWVETVTEGGRRFMAAWRKEEVDAARHRQEKREATRLGTLLSQTGGV